MAGLYDNSVIIERFLASVSATTLAQPFVAPADFEVVGLLAHLGTAPGSTNAVTVNINNAPTSQTGVSAYNLWTATNVPTITGTAANSTGTSTSTTLVQNKPYALNYPLPGPSGTTGFVTAQATSQTTETPVVSPPTVSKFLLLPLVAPDNTYTDFNGTVSTPANIIHAGDICSFVIAGTVGAAANLAISLFLQRR